MHPFHLIPFHTNALISLQLPVGAPNCKQTSLSPADPAHISPWTLSLYLGPPGQTAVDGRQRQSWTMTSHGRSAAATRQPLTSGGIRRRTDSPVAAAGTPPRRGNFGRQRAGDIPESRLTAAAAAMTGQLMVPEQGQGAGPGQGQGTGTGTGTGGGAWSLGWGGPRDEKLRFL